MSKGLEKYRRHLQNGHSYHRKDLTLKVIVMFELNNVIPVVTLTSRFYVKAVFDRTMLLDTADQVCWYS